MTSRNLFAVFIFIFIFVSIQGKAESNTCILDEVWRGDLDQICTKPEGLSVTYRDFLKVFGGKPKGKRYALVVGISDYDEASIWGNLDTRKDALRMRNYLLLEGGFDYVHTLTGRRASKERISKIMEDELTEVINPEDKFVLYWSGHGETRNINGTDIGYLVLSDSLGDEYSTMLPMDDILRWDRNISAEQVVYLLDSCFSGLALSQVKDRRVDELTRLSIANYSGPARHILTAGKEGERAIVDRTRKGSVFTLAILDGLRNGKANTQSAFGPDQVVSFFELEQYVAIETDIRRNRLRYTKEITPQSGIIGQRQGMFFFPLLSTVSSPDTEVKGLIELQSYLHDLGYSPGQVSGRLSFDTQAAIRAFQKDNQFHATGQPDRRTKARIIQQYIALFPNKFQTKGLDDNLDGCESANLALEHFLQIAPTDEQLRLFGELHSECKFLVAKIDNTISTRGVKFDAPAAIYGEASDTARVVELTQVRCTDAEGSENRVKVCRNALRSQNWTPAQAANFYNAIAVNLFNLSREKSALESLEKAYALDPNNHSVSLNISIINWRLGNFDTAQQYLEYAISTQLDKNQSNIVDRDLLTFLGAIQRDNGDTVAAFDSWVEVLESESQFFVRKWQAHLKRQGFFIADVDGNFGAATQAALKRCSEEKKCNPLMKITLSAWDPVPLAKVSLEAPLAQPLFDLSEANLGTQIGTGQCMSQGDYRYNLHFCIAMLEAREWGTQARSKFETAIGYLHAKLGEWAYSLARFDRAIEYSGPNEQLYYNRAFSLYKLGEYERALSDVQAAITLGNMLPEYLALRGSIYGRMKRLQEAKKDWFVVLNDTGPVKFTSKSPLELKQIVQTKLKASGYYKGDIDGQFGLNSEGALFECLKEKPCDLTEIEGLNSLATPHPAEGPLYPPLKRDPDAIQAYEDCIASSSKSNACSEAIGSGWLSDLELAVALRQKIMNELDLGSFEEAREDVEKYSMLSRANSKLGICELAWLRARIGLRTETFNDVTNAILDAEKHACGEFNSNIFRGFVFAAKGLPERALAVWELSLADGIISDGGREFWEEYLNEPSRGNYLSKNYVRQEDYSIIMYALRKCSVDPKCYSY